VIPTLLEKNLASTSKFFERTATVNRLVFLKMLLKKNRKFFERTAQDIISTVLIQNK
jgi:hypothetical protein